MNRPASGAKLTAAWHATAQALLLLAGLVGAAPAPAATPDAALPMAVQQVSPQGHFVQGQAALGSRQNRNFISNAGFVVTPAGVVLIDALGSPALARELLAAVARITPLPVTHVLVTHYHADHIYGLQVLHEAGARIVAHEKAREYLTSDAAALRLQASVADGLT